MQTYLTFDDLTFKLFKEAYKKAVAEGAAEFTFESNVFITLFAKYMIEYIETKQ